MTSLKYNSIWQVLNARNDTDAKYKTIEAIVDALEQKAVLRGREEAVDHIRKEFNDERYAELWPESERDEDDTEGSAAEFWMFFNPILDEARSGITDVCDKHRAPDCMECFYTTPPEETNK